MIYLIRRILLKVARMIARRLYKTPFEIPQGFRCVSFCFDDFPASAAETGAGLLEEFNARGTFYASLGLLGQENAGGKIASLEQALTLQSRGHEIGCHTYDHIICALKPASVIADSCDKNRKKAADNGLIFKQFAFPEGELGPAAKKVVAARYETARTVVKGINQGLCDAHYLKATPLYETDEASIFNLIDRVKVEGGWLILIGHDVSDTPLQYGIKRDFLRRLLNRLEELKIPSQPVGKVYPMLSCK